MSEGMEIASDISIRGTATAKALKVVITVLLQVLLQEGPVFSRSLNRILGNKDPGRSDSDHFEGDSFPFYHENLN